ncbi:MAG: SCO family protein, partial [Verrucomicrobiales bacterium]
WTTPLTPGDFAEGSPGTLLRMEKNSTDPIPGDAGDAGEKPVGKPRTDIVVFAGIFVVLVVAVFVLLNIMAARRGKAPVQLLEYSQVEDFSLVDQRGEETGRADLAGKIWVANFVFTSCATECPLLTKRMGEIQERFADREDVALVSISVDPQTDTPERLAEYAAKYGAGDDWFFLTGEVAEVDRLIKKSFLLPVARDEGERARIASANFVHSEKIAVVDREGIVRFYTDGLPAGATDRVAEAVDLLLAEPN